MAAARVVQAVFILSCCGIFAPISIAVRAQLANSPWPAFGGDAAHTRRSPYEGPVGTGVYVKWSFRTGNSVQSSPAIGVDGTVYVGSLDTKFYALNGTTGALRWSFTTDGIIVSSPAISAQGNVYFGAGSKLYALNSVTGTQAWTYSTGDIVYSSPNVGPDGTVYFGSYDHKVYALNGTTGALLCSFATGDRVYSSPAVASPAGVNTVYVGSLDGSMYALFAGNGSLRWSFATGGFILSSPAVDSDGTVYFGSYDQKWYAVAGTSGVLKWESESNLVGATVSSSAAVDNDGYIYFGSRHFTSQAPDGVFSLDTSTGAVRWHTSTQTGVFGSVVIDAGGLVFSAGGEGTPYEIYALNRATGTVKWNFTALDPDGDVYSSPAIGINNMLYIGSNDQHLYALATCPFGSYCAPPSFAVTPCPDFGVTCPLGSVTPLPCESGTFKNISGVSPCLPCLRGYYCPRSAGQPTICPQGAFCPASSKNSALCRAGTYNPEFGRDSEDACIDCPRGFSCPSAGMSAPTVCDPGTISQGGSSTCIGCLEGFSTNAKSGQTACDACPVGTYCARDGCGECTSCGNGFTTSGPGADSPLLCQPAPTSGFMEVYGKQVLAPVLSAFVSLLLLLLRMRYVDRSWSAYPVHDMLRKRLKLYLSSAPSEPLFVRDVLEILEHIQVNVPAAKDDALADSLVASIKTRCRFEPLSFLSGAVPNPLQRCGYERYTLDGATLWRQKQRIVDDVITALTSTSFETPSANASSVEMVVVKSDLHRQSLQ